MIGNVLLWEIPILDTVRGARPYSDRTDVLIVLINSAHGENAARDPASAIGARNCATRWCYEREQTTVPHTVRCESSTARPRSRRLGTTLFHRAGKRMVPTAAGQRVLATAQTTLLELKRLEDDLRRIAQGQDAVIRLSTECYTCYHWLPPLLNDFHRRFPHVDVQIVAEVTQDPLPALLDGRIDLALVHHDPHDERLSLSKLFRNEQVIVVRSDHRLARKRYIEPQDLADRARDLLSRAAETPFVLPGGADAGGCDAAQGVTHSADRSDR